MADYIPQWNVTRANLRENCDEGSRKTRMDHSATIYKKTGRHEYYHRPIEAAIEHMILSAAVTPEPQETVRKHRWETLIPYNMGRTNLTYSAITARNNLKAKGEMFIHAWLQIYWKGYTKRSTCGWSEHYERSIVWGPREGNAPELHFRYQTSHHVKAKHSTNDKELWKSIIKLVGHYTFAKSQTFSISLQSNFDFLKLTFDLKKFLLVVDV